MTASTTGSNCGHEMVIFGRDPRHTKTCSLTATPRALLMMIERCHTCPSLSPSIHGPANGLCCVEDTTSHVGRTRVLVPDVMVSCQLMRRHPCEVPSWWYSKRNPYHIKYRDVQLKRLGLSYDHFSSRLTSSPRPGACDATIFWSDDTPGLSHNPSSVSLL